MEVVDVYSGFLSSKLIEEESECGTMKHYVRKMVEWFGSHVGRV